MAEKKGKFAWVTHDVYLTRKDAQKVADKFKKKGRKVKVNHDRWGKGEKEHLWVVSKVKKY